MMTNFATIGNVTYRDLSALVKAECADFPQDGTTLIVTLTDGRVIHLEIARYTWLRFLVEATAEQRVNWEAIPSGIWWEDLDDGVSIEGLLRQERIDW